MYFIGVSRLGENCIYRIRCQLLFHAFVKSHRQNACQRMTLDCVTDNSKINGWNDYFVSQWLENPHLPISTWNVCGEEHRTNNTCEGYNSKLNRAVRKKHPNIYELIKVLQVEEASTRLMIHQTESGEPPKKRRNMYTKVNSKHIC